MHISTTAAPALNVVPAAWGDVSRFSRMSTAELIAVRDEAGDRVNVLDRTLREAARVEFLAVAAELIRRDGALIADTHDAADAAERAAAGFARGVVSVESLICASDRAFHAWRRAGVRAATVWDESGTDDRPPLSADLQRAADRACRAYRAGFRG